MLSVLGISPVIIKMNVFETYIMPNAPEDSRVHKF